MAAIEGRAEERERIIDAALELAAQGRWSEVTLNAIAEEAQVSLGRIYEDFGSRGDILAAFFRRIDAEVLGEEEDALSEEEPARDRLFDVLMRRFEALQPYHAAMSSIYADCACQPSVALTALPQLCRSMAWMLAAAGISAQGWRGLARVQGLTVLWLNTLRVWLRDESDDMGRTMAALDRNLRRAEGILQRLPRSRRYRGRYRDVPPREAPATPNNGNATEDSPDGAPA